MTNPQEAPALISVGAQALVENADRLGLMWQLRPATVVSASPLTATYDGDTEPIGMVSMVGQLLVGDRVFAISVPPAGNFVTGFVGSVCRRLIDGAYVQPATLASGVSAETNLDALNLSGRVLAGSTYIVTFQVRVAVTVTTDDWNINLRRDTALSGTQIGFYNWSGDDLIGTPNGQFIYQATADEQLSLFLSVVRSAGAGTITVSGAPSDDISRTFAMLELSGPSSVWRETS